MLVHDSCLKFSKKTRFFSGANKALAHPTVRGPPPLNVVRARKRKKFRLAASRFGGGWVGGTGTGTHETYETNVTYATGVWDLGRSHWVLWGLSFWDWSDWSDWVGLGRTGSDWVGRGRAGSGGVGRGRAGSGGVGRGRAGSGGSGGSGGVGQVGQVGLGMHQF